MTLEYAEGNFSTPRPRTAARVGSLFGWILLGAVLLFIGGMVFSPAAPVELLLLVFLSRSIQLLRRRRGAAVLAVIHQAVRLNLPIPQVLNAAARGEKGALRRRLEALAMALGEGQSLERAINSSVPEVTEADVRRIAIAEKIGRLDPCLIRLIDAIRPRGVGAVELAGIYWVYPLFFLAVFWLPSVFVMPKFVQIFRDFKQPLPWSAQLMIWVSNSPVVPVFFGMIAAIVGLAFIGQSFQAFWRTPRRYSWMDGAWMSHIAWWIPGLHGLIRDRGMAEMCDYLAKSVEIGQPFDQAVLEAAGVQANAVLRNRVGEWGRLIFNGVPIGQAANEARLPSILAGMFASVRDSDGIYQVLSFLARYYESRFDRMRELLRAMYLPAIVVLLGCFAALLALSFFQPLAALTKSLTPSVGGF